MSVYPTDELNVYRISCHTVGESDARYTVWLQFDTDDGTDETDVGDYDDHADAMAFVRANGRLMEEAPKPPRKLNAMIDKPRAEKMIRSIMAILPFDDGETVHDYGFTITATPETIELLKQSDSTFAGYVISSICPPAESKAHYEDWMRQTLKRTMK